MTSLPGRRPVAFASLPVVIIGMICLTAGCTGGRRGGGVAIRQLDARGGTGLSVHSPAFYGNQPIPAHHAADGANVSPPLRFTGIPAGARSIAVLVEDPDAPTPRPFVHWVIYNIGPDARGLAAAIPAGQKVPSLGDARQGRNDNGSVGWFGPRPPEGDPPHHYHFQVFALDRKLDLKGNVTRDDLVKAMRGRVLAKGEVIGTYERPKRDTD